MSESMSRVCWDWRTCSRSSVGLFGKTRPLVQPRQPFWVQNLWMWISSHSLVTVLEWKFDAWVGEAAADANSVVDWWGMMSAPSEREGGFADP